MPILHTPRLRLEPITDSHLEGMFVLNSDPEVMRYITGKPQSMDEVSAMIERVKRHWAEFGCSWWAWIEKSSGELIGAGCIQHLAHHAELGLEIGWRLRKDKWGHGFALEAAHTMAAFAFDDLQSPDLTAVCHPDNFASAKVMEKLGMSYRGIEKWYDTDTKTYFMTRAHYLKDR
jgi:RimJ/RimL family protein N-acetyltransferase